MKLTVIIPCLNEAKNIGVQLEALAGQCWSEPWEVIVADNGSTDRSSVIVEQYRDRFSNFRLIDASGRRGQAYARNLGASHARGELLAFCDADDEVAPGWIRAIGEALSRYDFVASRFDPTQLNEPWAIKSRMCPQQDGIQQYKYPPFLPHAAGSGLAVKRVLHDAIGGFDESLRILEDTDYCWRLQLAGVSLHFVPDAVVHYRFRHSLGRGFCQARGYAAHNVLLYKRYRSLGMPPLSFSGTTYIKSWIHLLRKLPRIRNRGKLAYWIWTFGWRIGRLEGSIKYRILAV